MCSVATVLCLCVCRRLPSMSADQLSVCLSAGGSRRRAQTSWRCRSLRRWAAAAEVTGSTTRPPSTHTATTPRAPGSSPPADRSTSTSRAATPDSGCSVVMKDRGSAAR